MLSLSCFSQALVKACQRNNFHHPLKSYELLQTQVQLFAVLAAASAR